MFNYLVKKGNQKPNKKKLNKDAIRFEENC